MARGRDPLYDLATFCCQQCAEKYLKAIIEETAGAIPKTHSLEKLLQLVAHIIRPCSGTSAGSAF
jgi:HEPN domain-containing protein